MASSRCVCCILLGLTIDSLAQRGLAKCAASEPRKLFPFFFLPCESQHARLLLFFLLLFCAQAPFRLRFEEKSFRLNHAVVSCDTRAAPISRCALKFGLVGFSSRDCRHPLFINTAKSNNKRSHRKKLNNVDRRFHFQLGLRFILIM